MIQIPKKNYTLPLQIITYHNRTLFLVTRKANLTPRRCKGHMFLTKFSNVQICHTAGTNPFVADKLSRVFATITNKLCQLQHETSPTP